MVTCEIKEEVFKHTLYIRFKAPVQELPQQLGRVYSAISQYLRELGADHAGAPFALYHNMDMQNLDVEAGFPVLKPLPARGEIRDGHIPGGHYAICHYTGPYDEVGPAYEALTEYAKENGYRPGNIAFEWYLNGPEVPPDKLKTDIAFPVTVDRVAHPEAH